MEVRSNRIGDIRSHYRRKLMHLYTEKEADSLLFTVLMEYCGMTKAEIIQRGISLGVDYSITHSCYDPDGSGRACGSCDSCLLRKKGFVDAGVLDLTIYS